MALLGGANIGRDSDTLASLNGQLCGALNGIDSAPREWVQGLTQSKHWERFYETAKLMTQLVVEQNKNARARVKEIEQLQAC